MNYNYEFSNLYDTLTGVRTINNTKIFTNYEDAKRYVESIRNNNGNYNVVVNHDGRITVNSSITETSNMTNTMYANERPMEKPNDVIYYQKLETPDEKDLRLKNKYKSYQLDSIKKEFNKYMNEDFDLSRILSMFGLDGSMFDYDYEKFIDYICNKRT